MAANKPTKPTPEVDEERGDLVFLSGQILAALIISESPESHKDMHDLVKRATQGAAMILDELDGKLIDPEPDPDEETEEDNEL